MTTLLSGADIPQERSGVILKKFIPHNPFFVDKFRYVQVVTLLGCIKNTLHAEIHNISTITLGLLMPIVNSWIIATRD